MSSIEALPGVVVAAPIPEPSGTATSPLAGDATVQSPGGRETIGELNSPASWVQVWVRTLLARHRCWELGDSESEIEDRINITPPPTHPGWPAPSTAFGPGKPEAGRRGGELPLSSAEALQGGSDATCDEEPWLRGAAGTTPASEPNTGVGYTRSLAQCLAGGTRRPG